MNITKQDLNKFIKHHIINLIWMDAQLSTKIINKYVYYPEFIKEFEKIKDWTECTGANTEIIRKNELFILIHFKNKPPKSIGITLHDSMDYHEKKVIEAKIELKII